MIDDDDKMYEREQIPLISQPSSSHLFLYLVYPTL